MDIHLHSESILNERTGEVAPPSEYVDNLRVLERAVTRLDDDLAGLKAEVKKARCDRRSARARCSRCSRRPAKEFDADAEES